MNDNYLVGPLPSLDKIKDTINTIDIRNNYINNIKSINPMLTKNMDIISSLGQKITSLPQWQLIAAEKTSNLGYIVNNTIRNTSPERSYVLHIGKRSLDGYKRDGAPIYGNFKTFEDL